MIYSTHSPDIYGARGFVAVANEAWNLAYLSHDYESGPPLDPMFGVNVRRTLQFDISTGYVDITGSLPEELTIIPWLRLPAPQFVAKVGALPRRLFDLMPMAAVYGGRRWHEVMLTRSYRFREPHDPVLDAPVTSTAQAQALLDKLR